MKPYFEGLRNQFYSALEEVKQAEDQKVYMVGCRDAGNYDYLFIVGSIMPGHFQFIHIDYSRMITFDAREVVDNWFKNMDDGFYEEYYDLFEANWISMEELMEHMKNYLEIYV